LRRHTQKPRQYSQHDSTGFTVATGINWCAWVCEWSCDGRNDILIFVVLCDRNKVKSSLVGDCQRREPSTIGSTAPNTSKCVDMLWMNSSTWVQWVRRGWRTREIEEKTKKDLSYPSIVSTFDPVSPSGSCAASPLMDSQFRILTCYIDCMCATLISKCTNVSKRRRQLLPGATAPLSACHEAPVKTLPIQADFSWSPLSHVPLCTAAFAFFLSSYYILLPFFLDLHVDPMRFIIPPPSSSTTHSSTPACPFGHKTHASSTRYTSSSGIVMYPQSLPFSVASNALPSWRCNLLCCGLLLPLTSAQRCPATHTYP